LRALALAVCWPLAWLSWKYVETPFRKPGLFRRRLHLVCATGATSLLLTLGGLFVMNQQGLPERFPPEIYTHQSYRYRIPEFVRYDHLPDPSELPVIGDQQSGVRPKVLLWGDSHAISIMPAFDVIGKEMKCGIYVAAQPGIPPLAGTWPLRKSFQSMDTGTAVLEFAERQKIEHVVLAARWNYYVFGDADGDCSHLICDASTHSTKPQQAEAVFRRSIRRTCDRLRAAGAQIWILRQVPFQPRNAPGTALRLAALHRDLNDLATTVDEHQQRFAAINRLLDFVAGDSVNYLDSLPFVADNTGRCRTTVDGVTIYRDHDHFSAHGARQLEPLLRPVFTDGAGRYQVVEGSSEKARL